MNNGLVARLVPVGVEESVKVGADLESLHEQMIRNAHALRDALLEDLNPQSLTYIEGLIEQFRVDLASYRVGAHEGAPTGT